MLCDDGTLLITEQRYKKIIPEVTINKYKRLVQIRNEATTEEEIQKLTKEIDNLFLKDNPDQFMVRPQFTKGLKSVPKKKKKRFVNEEEKENDKRRERAVKAVKEKC